MSERESTFLSQEITMIWKDVAAGKRPLQDYYEAVEEWKAAVEAEAEAAKTGGESEVPQEPLS